MCKVVFTKEEIRALLIQINARIDDLKQIQKQEAQDGNVKRVIEMEEAIEPILSGRDKMLDSLTSRA